MVNGEVQGCQSGVCQEPISGETIEVSSPCQGFHAEPWGAAAGFGPSLPLLLLAVVLRCAGMRSPLSPLPRRLLLPPLALSPLPRGLLPPLADGGPHTG